MSFPWERRLDVMECQQRAKESEQKQQAARADAQAQTKLIQDYFAKHAQTTPVIPGGAVCPLLTTWSDEGLARVVAALRKTDPENPGGMRVKRATLPNGET